MVIEKRRTVCRARAERGGGVAATGAGFVVAVSTNPQRRSAWKEVNRKN